MNSTVTAHQLYPLGRLDGMSIQRLNSVLGFAQVDATTPSVTYDGMTRDETAATAKRTVTDVMNALHGRALEEAAERFTLALYNLTR